MKPLDFAPTVNISLGLSIIRTSVDHWRACEIAGKNCADPIRMESALRLVAEMAGHDPRT